MSYVPDVTNKEALLTELESARNVAAELQAFETRVNEKLAQLKSLEARTVDDESLPSCAASWSTLPRRRLAASAG